MESSAHFRFFRPRYFSWIGGIGMSGLAQLALAGHDVAGSDRGLDEPAKWLYAALRRQGIRLYAQDGSGVRAEEPDALIISTAVEADNPDLQVLPTCPVVHRAKALLRRSIVWMASRLRWLGRAARHR